MANAAESLATATAAFVAARATADRAARAAQRMRRMYNSGAASAGELADMRELCAFHMAAFDAAEAVLLATLAYEEAHTPALDASQLDTYGALLAAVDAGERSPTFEQLVTRYA